MVVVVELVVHQQPGVQQLVVRQTIQIYELLSRCQLSLVVVLVVLVAETQLHETLQTSSALCQLQLYVYQLRLPL